MDICAVSIFWLLWTVLLGMGTDKDLLEDLFSVLVDKDLWRLYMAILCWTEELLNDFPQWPYHAVFPPAMEKEFLKMLS